MDIFGQLEKTHSKENSLEIISYIGTDEKKFSELMDCFFMKTQDYRVPQRAAHVVSLSFDKQPELIRPYLDQLIEFLYDPNLKGPLKRNILRILQFSEIPEEHKGKLFKRVYELLENPKEEIAVRAFSMTVLYNICKFYPELKPELEATILFILEEPNCSPGVKSRGNAVLKKIRQQALSTK